MPTPLQPEQLEHLGSMITIKGTNNCLGFLMPFPEKGVFDAHYGKVPVSEEHAKEHNRLMGEALIKGLDEGCQVGQGNTFYLTKKPAEAGRSPTMHRIATWDGQVVSDEVVKVSQLRYRFSRKGREFIVKVPRGDRQDVFVQRVK
jgi:hypothetical protein